LLYQIFVTELIYLSQCRVSLLVSRFNIAVRSIERPDSASPIMATALTRRLSPASTGPPPATASPISPAPDIGAKTTIDMVDASVRPLLAAQTQHGQAKVYALAHSTGVFVLRADSGIQPSYIADSSTPRYARGSHGAIFEGSNPGELDATP
jgi:hypothetical protein